MTSRIDWLTENRVIYLRLWGNLSPTEVRTTYDSLIIYYGQGQPPLYLVVDHTNINRYPISLNVYDFVIDGNPASKLKQVLIVGPNRQFRFLMRLFARVRQVPSIAFNTEQEALDFLSQHNALLPDANTH